MLQRILLSKWTMIVVILALGIAAQVYYATLTDPHQITAEIQPGMSMSAVERMMGRKADKG